MKQAFLFFYETFYYRNISYEVFESKTVCLQRISHLIFDHGLSGELLLRGEEIEKKLAELLK